jgi:hypothetical protein
MKWMALGTALVLSAILLPAGPAQAKGCLKGAMVGGVAGHYVGHHGWLGAAAGCLIGRHEANRPAHTPSRTNHQYYAGYR